jgi:hypothetical protein
LDCCQLVERSKSILCLFFQNQSYQTCPSYEEESLCLSQLSLKVVFQRVCFFRKGVESEILGLPKRVGDFYQLGNSEISLSAVGDLVFVTVESVLPVKLPARHAEESKYALAQH